MIGLAALPGAEAAFAFLLVLLGFVVLVLLGDDDLPGPKLCYSDDRGAGSPAIPDS